jgi:hypothetical protein
MTNEMSNHCIDAILYSLNQSQETKMNERPFQGLRGFLKDQEKIREEHDCVRIPFHLAMEIISDMKVMRDRSNYKIEKERKELPLGLTRNECAVSEPTKFFPEDHLSNILQGQFITHKGDANIFKERLERLAVEANQDNCRLIAKIDELVEQRNEKGNDNIALLNKVFNLETALKAKTKLKRAKKK